MSNEQVTIRTRDGNCLAMAMIPASNGSWPRVICYMDAGGVRPAVLDTRNNVAGRTGGGMALATAGTYEFCQPKCGNIQPSFSITISFISAVNTDCQSPARPLRRNVPFCAMPA